jgi:hypothetical protein
MNSNDETPVPTASERDAARARLARQIGRLLANEWLRNRAGNPVESSGTGQRAVSPNPSRQADGFGQPRSWSDHRGGAA